MSTEAPAALPGLPLLTASAAGTAVFTVTAVVAAVVGGWTLWPAFVVAVALFLAGCGLFVAAYATAVARSRSAEMGIGGLFFLAGRGTAPPKVKRALLGSFAIQVVVALTTAIARPFSTLAFGVLAPLFGVAVQGLWAARHGRFGARVAPTPRARRPVARDGGTVGEGEVGKNGDHG